MFREFLQKELAVADHIDKPSLYRVAGECCMDRNDLVTVFRLLARAGREDDLRRILDFFLLYEHDESCAYFYEEIFAIASAVPWEIRSQNPIGWLGFAAAYMGIWNDARTATLLAEAEDRFCSPASTLPQYLQRRVKGECEAIRGMLAFNDMEKMWAHYAEAHRLLNGPSQICSSDSLWSFGSPSMTFIAIRKAGDYERIITLAEQNTHIYRTISGGFGKGVEKVTRAEYWLERGDVARAEPLLCDIIRECGVGRDTEKNTTTLLVAGFNLMRLHILSGKPEEATRILEMMRSGIGHTQAVAHGHCLELTEGYINAVRGDIAAIPRWLLEGDVLEPPHSLLPQVFTFGLTVHGKALMLQKEWHKLASIAEKIPTASAPLESLFACIHGAVLGAIAAWHTSSREHALSLLRIALEHSHPDGIILPLAEYGGHILPLLRLFKRVYPADPANEHAEAIATLARRFAPVSGNARQRDNGVLTPREKEFMRYVGEGKSNAAIAAQLGISRYTVTEILQRIYKKLGASNRAEAARLFQQQETPR